MISVLCPTRARPGPCLASVESLLGNAEDPGRIEILLRRDDDDESDYSAVTEVARELGALRLLSWVGPRHGGYRSLHRMVNQLAATSAGDWLMLWNDDAAVLTAGWDSAVEAWPSAAPTVQNLNPAADDRLNQFPVMSRALYGLLGHFALDPHSDTYVQRMARGAGIEVDTWGVTIEHYRDATPESNPRQGVKGDATHTERTAANEVTSARFWSPPVQAMIAGDVARIRRALRGQR